MLKKRILYLLCAGVLLLGLLSACGKSEAKPEASEQPSQPKDSESPSSVVTDTRDPEEAYAPILQHFRDALETDGEPDKTAQSIVDFLKTDAQIKGTRELRELFYSMEEPLRGNSVIGYALLDINGDGSPELFILSEDDYSDDYTINALLTLKDDALVLAGAFWSRSSCALAKDGTIYINNSSGADDSEAASFSLNANTGALQLIETLDFP